MSSNNCLRGETLELAKSLEIKINDLLDNLPYSNDELKIPVFTKSLQEIAAFSYCASLDKNFQKLGDRLIQQICSVIFNSKTKLYEELLTSSEETDNFKSSSSETMNFFLELQKLVQTQDNIFMHLSGNAACATLVKRIMGEILEQNRSGLGPLNILALLCAISGLDIPLLITADSCCNSIFKNNQNKSINIIVLCDLLQACSSYPQYFNITGVPQGHLKPSDWLEGIMAALLDVKLIKNKNTWLKCFRSLLQISVAVVENNITSIIKSCLFNISVDTVDSKQEYCSLFIDLISLHSRLHQLPKFFVKLLLSLAECLKEGSAGKCISKGQIFPIILESMAFHFQELHFGQTIELWKIFSETYTTFGNMSQVFTDSTGVVFFLAQIFSTFLLHSKIFDPSTPSNIYEKYGDLVKHTTKELKKNVSVLSDTNKESQLLQQAFLILCHVVGEVKLIYDYHDETILSDAPIQGFSGNPFDCSLSFSFFTEEHAQILELLLKRENKVLSFLVFQLLLLKIKGIIHKKELSEDEKNHLKLSISTVMQHAEENIFNSASWDFNLNTLSTDNYGSAVWRMLLKFLPLILNVMDNKELLRLSGCFRDVVLQEDDSSANLNEMNLKTIMLMSLQNTYFQESKCFQPALIATVWKFDSQLLHKKRSSDENETGENFINVLIKLSVFRTKWMKFVESTPKSNQVEELNALWSSVKDICTLLNQVLQSQSSVRPKLKTKFYNILQLVDCLPLEYLLPGNQVRCLIGLSALFFLIPESCKSDEAFEIAEKTSKLLIAIFDGVRSIWFFDFITSGPYLREVVTTIEKLMDMKQSEEIPDFFRLLLDRVISLIAKNSEPLSMAGDYFSELVNKEKLSNVSILTLNLMLQKLTQLFHRTHLKPQYKEVCEKLTSLVCFCCAKVLKKHEVKSIDSTYSSLIQCYMEVIEILTMPSCTIEQKRKDKCLKQLPKAIQFAKQSILDGNKNSDTVFRFFARICKLYQELVSFIPEGLHYTIWDSIYCNFQQRCSQTTLQNKASLIQTIILEDYEIELLHSLFPLMPPQDINNIFEELFKQMKNWDIAVVNTLTLQMNLTIIRQIIDCDSQKQEHALPTQSLVNLLSELSYLVSQADDSDYHLSMVKIPVLQFINFIVKQKRSCLHDDQWLDCFSPCVVVKFHNLSSDLPTFVKSYDAVWNVVYNLLVYHPGVVIKTISVFMIIVTNLLKSLVIAGSQDVVYASDEDTQNKILLCAQNMNRLLTVIARHKTEFAKLVPFLLADYADCVQHITLESNIKGHLILGLDRLLGLCSEDSLKMISVNINHSCREIFSNLVKNYKQSRYRGDV